LRVEARINTICRFFVIRHRAAIPSAASKLPPGYRPYWLVAGTHGVRLGNDNVKIRTHFYPVVPRLHKPKNKSGANVWKSFRRTKFSEIFFSNSPLGMKPDFGARSPYSQKLS
jgi:hypothetical protein